MNCTKCEREIFHSHSDESCDYYQFLKKMKEDKYVSMGDHPDLAEILSCNLPVLQHRWPLDKNNPTQGHIDFVYAPHWVQKAADLYKDGHYGDMSLADFLMKMIPS